MVFSFVYGFGFIVMSACFSDRHKLLSTCPRPLQKRHLRRISALCAARSLVYLHDMPALAALLRLELHPHLVSL